MSRIVTMGEMMIRFMPPGNLRFEQAGSFDVFYGGDESIVATSLARFGMEVSYVTRLPENPLGRAAAASALEQTVLGDCNIITLDEVRELLKEGTWGRVQR